MGRKIRKVLIIIYFQLEKKKRACLIADDNFSDL